ncbi:hypothetical protein [Confluentibacter lentus]|uniref:hypothetical protein n=1 Tax=Confluentibacter lentus TaxID=1699412 RepID=UPI0012FE6BD6|nr:hypothetical protein [Confluentibacter lentus]
MSKDYPIGKNIESTNPFFEFHLLEENRKDYLNFMDFETFKGIVQKQPYPQSMQV